MLACSLLTVFINQCIASFSTAMPTCVCLIRTFRSKCAVKSDDNARLIFHSIALKRDKWRPIKGTPYFALSAVDRGALVASNCTGWSLKVSLT